MRAGLFAAIAMLAVMSLAAGAPVAQAVTGYQLTVTVTVDGQTSTSTLRVLDFNDDGVISVDVSSSLLSRIEGAFGTTEFVFPGSYTGTFTIFEHEVTVVLQSDDSFTLKFF